MNIGRNIIANDRSETYSAMFGFVSAGYYQQARTFGVELTLSY